MARQRKEKPIPGIKLQQPDRSGPTEKTLFDMAQERNLFEEADRRQRQAAADAPELSPGAERLLETFLWTITLTTIHFTFDVLVQRQYGTEISWPDATSRTLKAWLRMSLVKYLTKT